MEADIKYNKILKMEDVDVMTLFYKYKQLCQQTLNNNDSRKVRSFRK